MEFKLHKEPQDDQGVEKTQILDTRGHQQMIAAGPPSTVEEISKAGPSAGTGPWTQGFSKINLHDSVVHQHVAQSGGAGLRSLTSVASKLLLAGIGFIGILVMIGYFAMNYFEEEITSAMETPQGFAELISSWIPGLSVDDNRDQMNQSENPPQPRPGLQPVSTPIVAEAQVLVSESINTAPKVKGKLENEEGLNPYWGLSNDLISMPEGTSSKRKIMPEEEVSWANALKHQYPYQRYQAVLQIGQARYAGSETLLWFALYDEKLWIRMRALITLADFGVKVGLGHVKMAIGNEPPLRVANFFRRFEKRASPGGLYIMRHAIRLLPEQGRFVILKALERNRDEYRDMYMAAASLDRGPHIKRWLRENYIIFDMNGAHYQKYIAAITGAPTIPSEILDKRRLDGNERPSFMKSTQSAPSSEPYSIPISETEITSPSAASPDPVADAVVDPIGNPSNDVVPQSAPVETVPQENAVSDPPINPDPMMNVNESFDDF